MKTNLLNFLIALKNASQVNKDYLTIKSNNQVIKLIECLYSEKCILAFHFLANKTHIKVFLKRYLHLCFFKNLKIMSTGSFDTYLKYSELCKIVNKNKVLILSTSKGFLSAESCKQKHLGGKLLFIC
jgi:ribosomal protein S8